MILNALTIFHVALSLVGIGSGVVAIYGLLKAKAPGRWTQALLATTAATSLTGFLFPFHGVTPAQALGVLSLVALLIASLCDLSVPSPGDLAPDLCNHRGDGVLFQRFCADRSAFPAGSGAKRHRTDPVRTTFPDSAARRCCCSRRSEFEPRPQSRNGGWSRD